MPCRASQRIRALTLALQCALLGARVRTIHQLTGVRPSELLQLLFNDERQPPRGRAPDARDWFPTASLLERIEASILVATFARLRADGFCITESLLCAYRHYRHLYGDGCHIGFDRAFDLVAHASGLWIADTASIALMSCEDCGCTFLDMPIGQLRTHEDCPFCRLRVRYRQDPRVAAFFQHGPKRAPTARTSNAAPSEMCHRPNPLQLAWSVRRLKDNT